MSEKAQLVHNGLMSRRWLSTQTSAIRLSSFNVLGDELAQSGEFDSTPAAALEWPARSALLARALAALDGDASTDTHLLALIEVTHLHDFFVPTLAVANFQLVGSAARLKDTDERAPISVAIFLRVANGDDVRVHRVSTLFTPVAAVVVDLVVDGRKVCVAATHLKAKADFARQRSEQMAALMNCIGSNQRRVVLMGDFNAEPHEHCISVAKLYFGLRPHDWTHASTTRKSRRGEVVDHCIDYILVPEEAHVSHVLDRALFDGLLLPGDGIYPSDHVPVGCRITFALN